MTNTQTTPTQQTPQANILHPIAQVFTENKSEFEAAGLTVSALSGKAPEGAQLAQQGALEKLPEEKRKAVQTAMAEGYYITVEGQTFAPTKEGLERRGKRESLTQAAANGGRSALIEAGLWDEDTNLPENLDRLHAATSENGDISSTDEDDKKAEALLKGYRVEGNWWDKNKDWMIPLLTALAGTALGFALAKCLDSKDNDGANAATTLIEKTLSGTTNASSEKDNENKSGNEGAGKGSNPGQGNGNQNTGTGSNSGQGNNDQNTGTGSNGDQGNNGSSNPTLNDNSEKNITNQPSENEPAGNYFDLDLVR